MERFIEARVNEFLVGNFEALAKSRGVEIDVQFEHMFCLFLGFYKLHSKERVEILRSIALAGLKDHVH